MSRLVFDVEAVIDTDLPPFEPRADAKDPFPPAPFWRVVALCTISTSDAWIPARATVLDGDEESMLRAFVAICEEHKPALVTFNGRGFDLPVIEARCMRYGIPTPYLHSRDVRDRYRGHLDLADELSNFGAGRAARLDHWAKLIGFPGKVGVAGSDVAAMVAAGRLAEVRSYCLCDVSQTAAIAMAYAHSAGTLSRGNYAAAMAGLVALIDGDQRLRAVADGIDRTRLPVERVYTGDCPKIAEVA